MSVFCFVFCSVAVNRVATFKELDSDLFRHGAFATLDDIDLRALVKCMAPEPETKEVSVQWTSTNAFFFNMRIFHSRLTQSGHGTHYSRK